jgi:hypothetical protein
MEYDKRAVAYVARLERAVPPKGKMDFEHVEFGALFNALTTHVENGLGHPDVVQAYEHTFVVLATLRAVHPDRITKAKVIFHDLRKHLRRSLPDT